MTNFEIGTLVKVSTQFGILTGVIRYPFNSGKENQFFVSYQIGEINYNMPFSKKTGKAYGSNPAKREGHFIIF